MNHAHHARAARHSHDGDGNGLDVIPSEEFRQLLHVAGGVIELGAGDHQPPAFEQIGVEAAQGKTGAVGGDEKIGSLEVWGQGRNQMQLDGPLTQFRAGRGRRLRLTRIDGRHSLLTPGSTHVGTRGFRVVCLPLALDYGQSPGGTDVEAHAHAVTVDVMHQDGLALVVELQRGLVAGCGA